jgi:hypothetical protein
MKMKQRKCESFNTILIGDVLRNCCTVPEYQQTFIVRPPIQVVIIPTEGLLLNFSLLCVCVCVCVCVSLRETTRSHVSD